MLGDLNLALHEADELVFGKGLSPLNLVEELFLVIKAFDANQRA